MRYKYEENSNGHEIKDSCFATVIGPGYNGVIVMLDDCNEKAFAYSFNSLEKGTKVICSIRKFATKKKSMVVDIDSVLDLRMYA